MSNSRKSAGTPEEPKPSTPNSTSTITPPSWPVKSEHNTPVTPPAWPMDAENEGYMVFFGRGENEGEWKPMKIWYLSIEGAQPLKGQWSKAVKFPSKNGVAWWISLMSSSPCAEEDDSVPLDLDVKLHREGDSAMLVRSGERSGTPPWQGQH